MSTSASKAKRAALIAVLLLVLLILDVSLVLVPDLAWSPPYCSSIFTVLGGAHISYSSPRGMAIHDGDRARWVWDEEADPSPWPDNWEAQLSNRIVSPRTQARGLLTPFCILWYHTPGLVVPEELGGASTEARLRGELANRFSTDPVIGPRMPKWYWQKLATVEGVTITWNYALLLHDILFIVAVVAIGWHLLTLASLGVQRLRGPGPGFCRKCRYDLSGLTADRCPECGTQVERRPQ